MNAKYIAELHAALVDLKNRLRIGRISYMRGICNNIPTGEKAWIMDFMRRWPEHSGDTGFPVPSFNDMTPHDKYMKTDNVWVGEYGAARMRLLDFLIEETKP